MLLSVLGSSSKGNCYVLHNETEALILEAGVNPIQVKMVIDFRIDKIRGVCISHEHL